MDINEIFDPMFDVLADHLERTKNNSDIRYEYWKMMSSNNWANRNFDNLVKGALGFLLLESPRFGSNQRFEQIIPDLAAKWVVMDLSDWVVSDKELMNAVPRDVLRDCERASDDYQAILRDIDRLQAENERNSNRRDYSSSSSRGGFNNSRGGAGGRTSAFSTSSRRGSADNGRPASGLSAAIENNSRSGSSRGAVERERVELLPLTDREKPLADEQRPSRLARQPEPAREPVSRLEGPDFTLARPFDKFWFDDECWIPAHLSKLVLQPRKGEFAAFETAYNPRKKFRFHVVDKNNVVREELKDMTKDMDYMRHELNSSSRVRLTDDANPKYTPTEKPGYVPPSKLPDEAGTVLRAARSVEMVNDTLLAASSVVEGELLAQFEHAGSGNITSVLNYSVTVPVMVTNEENINILREVADSINLTDAAKKMNDCADVVDPAAWDYINQRFTKMLNNVLAHQYGLKINSTDFAKDYDTLIKWMKSKDELLARNFSMYTRYIPQAVFFELSDEQRICYLSGMLNIEEAELERTKPNILCFQERYTVVLTGFTLGDTGLLLTEKSQLLDEDASPSLASVIQKAKTLNAELQQGATMYILTRDRQRIEVLESATDSDRVLLRLLQL